MRDTLSCACNLEEIVATRSKIAARNKERDELLAFVRADALATEAADFRFLALAGMAKGNVENSKRLESELEELNQSALAFDAFFGLVERLTEYRSELASRFPNANP